MKGSSTIEQLLPERVRSEGFTSSLLQEYVENLQRRIAQVRGGVYRAAQDACTAGESSTEDQRLAFLEGLSALRSVPGEQCEMDVQLASLAQQYRAACYELGRTEEAAQVLHIVAGLQHKLASLDSHINAGRYCAAAELSVELQKLQGSRSGVVQEDAMERVSAACAQRTQQLKAAMWKELGDVIVPQGQEKGTQQAQRVVQVSAVVSRGASVTELWSAMELLGMWEEAAEKLAEALYTQVFEPLISREAVELSVAEGQSGRYSLYITHPPSEPASPAPAREDTLLSLLTFLATHLFPGDQSRLGQVSRHLWPRISHQYITSCLTPNLPHGDADIDDFQTVAQRCQQFESAASVVGYLPEPASGPIHQAVKEALDQFLHHKRRKVVAAARELLLSQSYESIAMGLPLPIDYPAGVTTTHQPPHNNQAQQTGGSRREVGVVDVVEMRQGDDDEGGVRWGPPADEGPVLATGRYHITPTAQKLHELMVDALSQACSSGSSFISSSMCQAVVDIAVLIIALPPVLQARELQVPHVCALYHNDCQHISAMMMTLPYAFTPLLQKLMGSGVDFMDVAMKLREKGKAVFKELLSRQVSEMVCLLDGAGGFRRVHDAQRGIAVRKALQQLLHSMRRLADVLRGVLTQRDHVIAAAILLQEVAKRIAGDIMSIKDLSVEESEDLPHILAPFLEDAPTALIVGSSAAKAASSAPADELPASDLVRALVDRTVAFKKLKELCVLMTMRLVDIRSRWLSGSCRAAGLAAESVCHLIHAQFEDTQLRQEVLADIMDNT